MFSRCVCFIIIIIVNISFSWGITRLYPELRSRPIKGNVGKPLLLTSVINAGRSDLARNHSSVKPLIKNVLSYSGFFTVDKLYNSNLFFWFFPAENNSETAPVVLSLEGGPGATLMFTLFQENGPFYITEQQTLESRHYRWTLTHNVIYIDNPVGTGYSFTDDDKGYSKNQEDVGNNLYNAMIQFFQMFPEYRNNDFFITGEAYAGKYVPAIAYTIHTRNPDAKLKINLKGLAIGNGWIDPEHMMIYSDYLYQIGLIDANGKDAMKKKENEIVSYIQEKNWMKALESFDQLLLSNKQPSLFTNLTGFSFFYNFLFPTSENYINFEKLSDFVQTKEFRKALHVGDTVFHDNDKVIDMLLADIMQSVKPWLEVLLENYHILMYNGQLDIVAAYPLTLGFYQTLNWTGSEAYKTAQRKQWYVNGTLAGYTKTVKNFTEVLVRNAGHFVSTDQPQWALDLITRFTHNELL